MDQQNLKLQPAATQPNRWSCLATSFGMAFKTSYDKIVTWLKVDPDKVINFDISKDSPNSRRSIGINELIYYGMMHGYLSTPIIPKITNDEQSCMYIIDLKQDSELWKYSGVVNVDIPGKPGHAVYWDGSIIHDPVGVTYSLERLYAKYDIFTFWVVTCTVQKK